MKTWVHLFRVQVLLLGVLGLMLGQGQALAAGFTIGPPPMSYPPKIISVIDTVPQKSKPTVVTVRARGQKQRLLDESATPPTNFCDETISVNPPLVTQGRIWYTLSTDEQRANWTSVDMTVVGTPTDPNGCDHDPVETELTGIIPAAALESAVEGDSLIYYVQVIDTSGNKASYTPDAAAGNLPEGNPDLQTVPNLAAKPAKDGETMLIMDVAGDVRGNIGQTISASAVDILGANVGIGTEHIMVNMKLQGKPENDGGVIEGYVGVFIRGDAVDDDPNDALFPEGSYALSTAFQGVLPDMVHTVWDLRCMNNWLTSGGGTDALLACTLYAGGAGTGMLEKDGQGYLNWRLEHSAQGVSLIGSDGGVEVVLGTGQIDIAAPEGTSPFWVTDYTHGVTYYKKTMERTIHTTVHPPPPCGGMSVETISTETDTCRVKWNNDATMTGGGYFIFRSTKKDGGGVSGPELTILNPNSPVPQGAAGAENFFEDAGLTQDGKVYHYWCMPRDADGRMWYPPGNNPIKALCTISGNCDDYGGGNWPTNAPVSCQSSDVPAPVDPVDLSSETLEGQKLRINVGWKPGFLEFDPSMTGSGAGFLIERNGIPIGFKPFVVGTQTYSFLDAICVQTGESFEYKIKARDVGGNTSPGATVTGTCADREPPGLVKNLIALNQTNQGDPSGRVKLIWDPLEDKDWNEDFKEYVVYRCASGLDDKGDCTDGLLPTDKSNYTQISCPNMEVRGTPNNPPTCVDQDGLEPWHFYHYVVTARDKETVANESPFPSFTYNQTAYPYRWARVRPRPLHGPTPPDRPRDLNAQDTKEGGSCVLNLKMPLRLADSPPGDKFCANGGTAGYCTGDETDVLPLEVFQYVVVAAASPATPSDKSAPRCGTGTYPGTLSDPDALIPITCSGLENGTNYNINAFAINSFFIPAEGDFANQAATCTPTDEKPPAAPINGKILGFWAPEEFGGMPGSFNGFAIGWNAGEPVEQGDGFRVYACSEFEGCTTFTKLHTESLADTSFCTVGDYSELAGSDFCFVHDFGGLSYGFGYKVTALDAAGNESPLASFGTLWGTRNNAWPAATLQSCFTEEINGSDKVNCFWEAYPNSGDIDNLILAACKTEWYGVGDLPSPNCDSSSKWIEVNSNISKNVNTVSVPAGVLDQGCYQFAVLANGVDGKSNVLLAPKFPGGNPGSCVGVKGTLIEIFPPFPTPPTSPFPVTIPAYVKRTDIPKPVFKVVNEVTGNICQQYTSDGEISINNPQSCENGVLVKACDLPQGWLRNPKDGCVPCGRILNIAQEANINCILETAEAGGDTNGDGKVDLMDFGRFKQEFNKAPDKADFNQDEKVNLSDFGILRRNFGFTSN